MISYNIRTSIMNLMYSFPIEVVDLKLTTLTMVCDLGEYSGMFKSVAASPGPPSSPFKRLQSSHRQAMRSAADLKRLAEAESLFWGTEYLQLHSEPGYFRRQVEAAARIRPELIPDANGDAPTAEKLLATPRYIAQQIRYFIKNTLVHLAVWNVVVEYLKDIERLDEAEGVPGQKTMRHKLMGSVKCLIVQEIEKLSARVRYGIMFHPATKGQFTRVSVSAFVDVGDR